MLVLIGTVELSAAQEGNLKQITENFPKLKYTVYKKGQLFAEVESALDGTEERAILKAAEKLPETLTQENLDKEAYKDSVLLGKTPAEIDVLIDQTIVADPSVKTFFKDLTKTVAGLARRAGFEK